MAGFQYRRRSILLLQEHLDDVNARIRRLEEPAMPSRSFSAQVQR